MKINPYPTSKGFGLRVHRAEQMLKRYANDYQYNIHTQAFDNCFEMHDGDAVVFALMSKAKAEPDQYQKSFLSKGIKGAFGRHVGEAFPDLWEQTYQNGLKLLQPLKPTELDLSENA